VLEVKEDDEKGEDEKEVVKTGEIARLRGLSDEEAEEEHDDWLNTFYPAREKWKILGLFPGQGRYELERVLPKDTCKRNAGIPRDVKTRQDWTVTWSLEVCSSACCQRLMSDFRSLQISCRMHVYGIRSSRTSTTIRRH
jgi:hypothetical protein